jgi:hypothetical protein
MTQTSEPFTALFILVDGLNRGYDDDWAVRPAMPGYKFPIARTFGSKSEALDYAHASFRQPVFCGQPSDGDVMALYDRLSPKENLSRRPVSQPPPTFLGA